MPARHFRGRDPEQGFGNRVQELDDAGRISPQDGVANRAERDFGPLFFVPQPALQPLPFGDVPGNRGEEVHGTIAAAVTQHHLAEGDFPARGGEDGALTAPGTVPGRDRQRLGPEQQLGPLGRLRRHARPPRGDAEQGVRRFVDVDRLSRRIGEGDRVSGGLEDRRQPALEGGEGFRAPPGLEHTQQRRHEQGQGDDQAREDGAPGRFADPVGLRGVGLHCEPEAEVVVPLPRADHLDAAIVDIAVEVLTGLTPNRGFRHPGQAAPARLTQHPVRTHPAPDGAAAENLPAAIEEVGLAQGTVVALLRHNGQFPLGGQHEGQDRDGFALAVPDGGERQQADDAERVGGVGTQGRHPIHGPVDDRANRVGQFQGQGVRRAKQDRSVTRDEPESAQSVGAHCRTQVVPGGAQGGRPVLTPRGADALLQQSAQLAAAADRGGENQLAGAPVLGGFVGSRQHGGQGPMGPGADRGVNAVERPEGPRHHPDHK